MGKDHRIIKSRQTRIFLYSFLCVSILFAAIFITAQYIVSVSFNQKKTYLMALSRTLAAGLGEGGYDEILQKAGIAPDAPKIEKIEILNEKLNTVTENIANSLPDIGAGFYHKELDAILTYGPAKKFGGFEWDDKQSDGKYTGNDNTRKHFVGVPILQKHLGRTVMKNNEELFSSGAPGSMVRGKIYNAMTPLFRNGKVVGYVWVNEPKSEVDNALNMIRLRIFVIAGISYFLVACLLMYLFHNAVQAERTAKIAAESANAAQKSFLAHMSHEIRTPLNGVIGISGLLKQTELSDKQKEYVNLLRISANHLLTFINDILDFSKIEAGKLNIENIEFDLPDTIQTVLKIITSKAQEKKINLLSRFSEDVPQYVLGDPIRLRQIALNLVNNALKFTEKGSITVGVELESCSRTDTGETAVILFTVSDTGIGIPKEKIDRLFASFIQADLSHTRKYGGTGLGLAISKELVHLMGGKISVESTENAGSTFWFKIPFKVVSNSHLQYDGSSSCFGKIISTGNRLSDLSEYKILIAEDNKINQIVVGEILSQAGFRFDCVADGKLAVEALENNRYDLILMDCQMPEMDGFETTAYIRQKEEELNAGKNGTETAEIHIPIIALTASATTDDKELCLEAGMDDYCAKPIDPARLIAAVEKMLWKNSRKNQQP